jgi:hypothetical protein
MARKTLFPPTGMSALQSMIFDWALARKYIIFCSEAKMQFLPGLRWRERATSEAEQR